MDFITFLQSHITFSGVASVCALGLTVYQLSATRRHNRLSVRPMLHIYSHTIHADHGYEDTSELVNSGLGPAIITKFEVRKEDGVPLVWKDSDDLMEQIQKILPVGRIDGIREFRPGAVIDAGQRCPLIKVFVPQQDKARIKDIEKTVQKLSLHIEYESMYGEKQPPFNSRQGMAAPQPPALSRIFGFVERSRLRRTPPLPGFGLFARVLLSGIARHEHLFDRVYGA